MKSKYFIIPLLIIFSFAFVSATYYETADSYSNVDGVWQPEGSYIIDGDWGTGANVDWGGCSNVNNYLISTYNFTETFEVTSAIWEVKDRITTQNISIPSDCISSNGLILRVDNVGECSIISEDPPDFLYNNYITYSCYNFVTEGYEALLPEISILNNGGSEVFYEEGLYLELVEPIEPEPEQQTNNNLEVVITQSPAPIFSVLDLGTFSSINTDGIKDWAKDNQRILLFILIIGTIFLITKKK